MKDEIRQFALSLGVDDIGFAKCEDYDSPKSFQPSHFLPSAKTIIVLISKELSSCESPSTTIAMNGRLDMNSFQRYCSYRITRFIEAQFGGLVVSLPYSMPMEISEGRQGIADFSQRHAAVAAGLGVLGRHNLLLHPRYGTRVGITSLITDLDIPSDKKVENSLCINCNLCVINCPARALDQEGQTNVPKCVANSQPYGTRNNIKFWMKMMESSTEDQKQLLGSVDYRRLNQASSIGMQYYCFNCMKICPIGQEK